MRYYQNVSDLGDLQVALREALDVKAHRYDYQHLGKNKTCLLIFFNNSLRTRLSTQKAAQNLGMNTIVLDVNAGAWSSRWNVPPVIRSRRLPTSSPSRSTRSRLVRRSL